MELQEFVAEALSQIIQGVKSAQKTSSELGATINPEIPNHRLEKHGLMSITKTAGDKSNPVLFVEFDTAVTIVEGDGVKAGAGISVFGSNIGVGIGTKDESSTVSRIKFKIPIILPSQ